MSPQSPMSLKFLSGGLLLCVFVWLCLFCFSNFSSGSESLDLGAFSYSLRCHRYLKEDKPHGSAGGLYKFRDLILEDNPVFILFPF